eukprot:GFYU01008491.1.p1 GENE.GFYU01008491.1~~GFYU01008491.1.p1  ORF type:complete len:218 (-),score=23.27 GFYU01008491.1:51-704(-)
MGIAVNGKEALSLTLFLYEQGDKVGKAMAWVSLLPILIGFGFGMHFLFVRDINSIITLAGVICSTAFNVVLKNALKEPRPEGCERHDYGLPSDHAQFTFFVATVFMMSLLRRQLPKHRASNAVKILAMYGVCVLVAFSRVYLRYHTEKQVLLGGTLGIIIGVIWYYFTVAIHPMVKVVLEFGICKYFHIMDNSDLPDVVEHNYQAYQSRRKKTLKVQ